MFDTHNESLYTVHVGAKYLELQNHPFYNISHERLCITRIHMSKTSLIVVKKVIVMNDLKGPLFIVSSVALFEAQLRAFCW